MLRVQAVYWQRKSRWCAYDNDRQCESKRELTGEKSTNLVEMNCNTM